MAYNRSAAGPARLFRRRSGAFGPCGPHRRCGLILVELLVTVVIVSIALGAAAILMDISWISYRDALYQNSVNYEARRALDQICDDVRMGGAQRDLMTQRPIAALPQVKPYNANSPTSSSQEDRISYVFYAEGTAAIGYRLGTANGLTYAGRWPNIRTSEAVARFLNTITFEYEYRVRNTSNINDPWQFVRVSRPSAAQAPYLTTIYVTVNTRFAPEGEGTNKPVFQRTLKSAVHMRAPYNSVPPPAP